MTLLEYLDRRADRRALRPSVIDRLAPSDFRGWLGFGLFAQSTFLFCLIAWNEKLQESQGFLTLASAVIVTGWIGGAAAFAYAAGKNSAERSEQVSAALRIAEASGPTSPKPDVMLKPGETAQAEGSQQ